MQFQTILRKGHISIEILSNHACLLETYKNSFKILLAQCVCSPGGTGSSLGPGDRRVANAKQVLKKDFA